MDWDKLRIFHAVAEAGSFTHAGEHLNLSQSAVSRQISALEDSLNTTLFHRHARGLALTEQGELLYRTVKDVFAKLAVTEAMLNEGRERPSGPLRITTTVGFGSTWLSPRMREFLDLYPDIQVSLIVDDSEVELGMGRADVAIRMVPPRQADLIQRRLLTVHSHVYASPEYLETHGMPAGTHDLDRHHLIGYLDEAAHLPPAAMNWLLDAGQPNRPRRPILRVNNIYAMYRAAQSGVGLASLPDYMVHERTGLVRVLPELEGPALDTFFVYPEELRNSKRIMVFRDFLVRKVAESQF